MTMKPNAGSTNGSLFGGLIFAAGLVASFVMYFRMVTPLTNAVALLVFSSFAMGFICAALFARRESRWRYWVGATWAFASWMFLVPIFQWWGFALAAATGIVIWRAPRWAKSVRRRRALDAADKLLRVHRPSDDQTWSLDDWDWALREIGTTEALEQATIHEKLRNGRPWRRLRIVR
ncbi:hypothetical protein [Mycobacterium sp. D16R24]|uniref:hypothetical protein n=1 Tax=Mycobacterium sp. D16R24 TaxID=1855656 RepID=UPI000993EAEF|nr:hypothetical protein [Mycobacterium sp. D16R24]